MDGNNKRQEWNQTNGRRKSRNEYMDAADLNFLASLMSVVNTLHSVNTCDIWRELCQPGFMKMTEEEQKMEVFNTSKDVHQRGMNRLQVRSPSKSVSNTFEESFVEVEFRPVSYKKLEDVHIAIRDGFLLVSIGDPSMNLHVLLDISASASKSIGSSSCLFLTHFVLDGLPIRFEGRLLFENMIGNAILHALEIPEK